MDNIERRKQLGDAIRQIRENQNLSQRKLAYMLGHSSHSYVNEIEQGKVSVGFDNICEIADALDVDVRDFFVNL